MIATTPMGTLDRERGEVRLERDLPGPIDRVWQLITDAKGSASWFGDGWTIPPQAGATWRHASDMHGTVRVYDAPNVLELTWNDDHHDDASIVDSILRIQLREAGERVHLTLTHRGLPLAAMRGKGPGWHAYLDTLAATLHGESLDPMARMAEVRPAYERELV